MAFVQAEFEAISAAAGSLAGIGSGVSAQNAAAAAPTTGVVPAAADPISAMTAMQFVAQATQYQTISAMAQEIHNQFVSTIRVISRGGACPLKYPTVTAVAVIVFSIQLYLANECFLAGCLLTSQNMQPNMNTKPAHSRSMNG